MSSTIIARVVMTADGNVHILMNNKQSVLCTNHNLLKLITDPYKFIEEDFREYYITTRYLNPHFGDIEDVSGLTLALVYSDKSFKCDFPEIFNSIATTTLEQPIISINFGDYIFKDTFLDEKEYFLHFYLTLTNRPRSNTTINRKINIDHSLQERYINETLQDAFSVLNENISKPEPIVEKIDSESMANEINETKEWLTVKEFAQKNNISIQTVISNINKGKYTSPKKIRNKWYLYKDDEIVEPDRRANRGARLKPEKRTKLKSYAYEDVQDFIKKRKLFTDKVAEYIRTYEEVRYYEKNNYHEVEWDGQSALIIDINPEYYSELRGKTNRELISEGSSPVVPGNDQFCFHIHHIGQKKDSPFAIIPQQDHNSSEWGPFFHSHSSGDNELHSKEFEIKKQAFWNNYLRMYDIYSSYSKIPFLNSKHTKHKR